MSWSPSYSSIQYSAVVNSTDVRAEALDRRYKLIMPIEPIDDQSLCRDEFIRRILADLDLPEIPKDSFDFFDSSDNFANDDPNTDTNDNVDDNLYDEEDDDDRVGLDPMLHKIGSGTSVFSLAPSYMLKNEISFSSFSSFLRKMKRKTQLSSILSKISTIELKQEVEHLNTPGQNRYKLLMEAMQRSSLFFANTRTIFRLFILQHSSLNQGKLFCKDVPHKLFSWSLEDFFMRRELRNFVYLDVLVRSYDWDSLEWAKFRCDLTETLRFFEFFCEEINKSEGYRKMLSVLWEQKQMLFIDKALERSLSEGQAELAAASDKSEHFTQIWWNQYKSHLAASLQRRLTEITLRSPIEMRYVKGYYQSMVEMDSMKCNVRTNELQKAVKNIKETLRVKHITSSAALEVYYNIIDNYRNRINFFTQRLEHDLEYWEDKILMTGFRLSKAKDDLIDAKEKMAFMQKRIAQVRAQIAEEELEQYNRLANEQQKIADAENARRLEKLDKKKKLKAQRAAAVASRQKRKPSLKQRKTSKELTEGASGST